MLVAADAGKNAVLILLILQAAFDTVDHNVFIAQLEHLIGIRGTALQFSTLISKTGLFL